MNDVDVVIIGAGLSGIGMAAHLRTELPHLTYTILEGRDTLGGTWDLFRYPGIRSDSDMYTLGYRFRPWLGEQAIADGESIRRYLHETAAEYDIDTQIRYGHRVEQLAWSTSDSLWTVTARLNSGDTTTVTARFVISCSGYYRYDQGYLPDFAGVERFAGQVVHPQHWPADLDYTGKRVAIIGSGATAVTLAPSMAAAAEHVTMVQRSPTYIVSAPAKDPLAKRLRFLPEKTAARAIRAVNIARGVLIYQLCQRYPEKMKSVLRKYQRRWLPAGFDIDTHLTPDYNLWDQRLCLASNGDFFRAIRKGHVSISTGAIDTFTESGLRLVTGEEVAADVIVTATGLNLQAFGGASVVVDGEPLDLSDTMGYKGVMLSGVPNFGHIIGYVNASWTLKLDLAADYLCRVLKHMRAKGFDVCVPVRDPAVAEAPFMALTSGYVQRGASQLPKQGIVAPWRMNMNYYRDAIALRRRRVDDGVLAFTRRPSGNDRQQGRTLSGDAVSG